MNAALTIPFSGFRNWLAAIILLAILALLPAQEARPVYIRIQNSLEPVLDPKLTITSSFDASTKDYALVRHVDYFYELTLPPGKYYLDYGTINKKPFYVMPEFSHALVFDLSDSWKPLPWADGQTIQVDSLRMHVIGNKTWLFQTAKGKEHKWLLAGDNEEDHKTMLTLLYSLGHCGKELASVLFPREANRYGASENHLVLPELNKSIYEAIPLLVEANIESAIVIDPNSENDPIEAGPGVRSSYRSLMNWISQDRFDKLQVYRTNSGRWVFLYTLK
jgi:hypothetical protein